MIFTCSVKFPQKRAVLYWCHVSEEPWWQLFELSTYMYFYQNNIRNTEEAV